MFLTSSEFGETQRMSQVILISIFIDNNQSEFFPYITGQKKKKTTRVQKAK